MRLPSPAVLRTLPSGLALALALTPPAAPAAESPAPPDGLPEPVSYYEHVRPVFQAKCQGCHQPAKSQGDYVMTEVAALIAGGASGTAVVPGKPGESYLLDLVVTHEGDEGPEMPPKDEPLTEYEIRLVSRWIEQGAPDDTPENALQLYTSANPPRYAVPPVITSMDYSPDGEWLAVAGFHEVLLHRADGAGTPRRLVGLSERIESVRFSPDGGRLAVAGGLPGRMGEIQIWSLADDELDLSRIVGFDTAYGASWSPDGQLVAFGLPDNTVRAIRAEDGEQALFMGSHNDWVLDTGWSLEGDHLVSVGRDMTAKLTETATERFIDNITSITPGALMGGLNAVVRHPSEEHILVGGADGVPQIYRMHRETVRRIGDNANLIRKYPAMRGRIWGVAFSPDGKTFAAVSSLDGRGQIGLYRSDYDATITPELKKLFETARRNPEEGGTTDPGIEEFHTRGAERIGSVDFDTALFSVAFSPDGATVAAGGADGEVRLLDAADLSLRLGFVPVEVDSALAESQPDPARENLKTASRHPDEESLPEGRRVVSLEVHPPGIALDSVHAYRQIVVTGTLDNGDRADLTRLAELSFDTPVAAADERGVVRPAAEEDGEAVLTVSYDGASAAVPVAVSGQDAPFHPDFLLDVNPIITHLGCNTGTCHGANDGRNGFKLSLRGYDPLFDVRAFGDDHAARRVNYASPDDSLMLLKATAAVPHEGRMLTEPGSRYYHLVRQWIAEGTRLDTDAPRVASIELFPENPVVPDAGGRQQFRVTARYSDGSERDVTREAFIESGDPEVAEHDDLGLLATLRRGEAPVLARYEGAYAATTLTVMGDRAGFTWEEPETWGEIDELVAAKWERMRIRPSGLCSDEEFIRRVHLDLTGLPPAADRVRAFAADERPVREKRDALIDELVGSPAFVDHWTNKWSDLLQVNSKFLGGEGARIFRDWIRGEIEANTPYDEFVYRILTASGSNKENPAASYYKILRDPDEIMENTTHLFLATRFNCNKCHDHPFERWTQDQYYETAAWFARVDLARDRENAPEQNIGGSAVEGARPLYEIVSDKEEGEVVHERTGEIQPPALPYETAYSAERFADPANPTRREEVASWIVSPENPFFAYSYANRVWGYLLGTGVIEPLDDLRAGNPPTNPELLEHLTRRFIDSGFDARALIAEICKSRTYQLSIEPNEWNADDEINFSRAKARRLPAEVLYDAVHFVTGAKPEIPGAAAGTRASQLPDAQLDLKSGFLATLGRPPRESACECERSAEMQMSAVMAFLSGPAVGDAIADEDNELPRLVRSVADDRSLVEEIYYRVLSRKPSPAEIDAALASMAEIDDDHQTLLKEAAAAEAAWVEERSALEIERLRAVAEARAAIEDYTPEYTRKKNEAEAARKERAAAALAALEERRSGLPGLVEEFASSLQADRLWTRWRVLHPEEAAASDKSEVEILPDGSVRSKGGSRPRNLDFDLAGATDALGITGVMIESIPDETFPGFGAGLNPGGNFVVSEVRADWRSAAEPDKARPLKFSDARADFNQEGFDVKNAINGSLERSVKGWALGGSNLQAPHRAHFRFEKPVPGDEEGARLTVQVLCRYGGGEYALGRFRVWYTTDSDPLAIGLPAAVAEAVATPPAARSEEQRAALETHVAENDEELLKLRFAHAKELRPLPEDPEMRRLRAALAEAETPVAEPPALVQLREDTAHSVRQAADRRLTAAQDLVWALVNSPSFLFNR